jgi:hypothetical protein
MDSSCKELETLDKRVPEMKNSSLLANVRMVSSKLLPSTFTAFLHVKTEWGGGAFVTSTMEMGLDEPWTPNSTQLMLLELRH